MKKGFLLLVVLLMSFVLILCACEDKKEEAKQEVTPVIEENNEEFVEENYEEENKVVDPADLEKLVVELNGKTIKIGEKFADVKDNFEAEVNPAQSYTPCGGSDDAKNTTHYYDGLEIEEVADGTVFHAKVSGFDNPDSKATIAGIKLGDTAETVRAHFGTTPDTDSESVINYTFGTLALSVSFDFEGTGLVDYISLDDYALGGM